MDAGPLPCERRGNYLFAITPCSAQRLTIAETCGPVRTARFGALHWAARWRRGEWDEMGIGRKLKRG